MLILSVVLALTFQYSLAPFILGEENANNENGGGGGGRSWWKVFRHTPGVGKHVYESWTRGCEGGGGANNFNSSLAQCAGNAGVYRPTFFSFLFFTIASIASRLRPSINRQVWPAKYGIYLLLVLASIFISNVPWFLTIFLHVSRIGAMIFIVVQQIILIDLAYNWNDTWVGKADAADRIEWGSGAFWLRATIGIAASFYVLSFVGIGILYHYFSGCGGNVTIITMTLIGIVGVTAVQLSGLEGSLLTSSVISLYAVYLAYSAVSKNPHAVCNPQLASEKDPYGIIMGLILTVVSLVWTGWSWTAEDRLKSVEGVKRARSLGTTGHAASFRRGQDPVLDLDQPFLEYYDEIQPPPTGLALSSDGNIDEDSLASHHHSSEVWKLNAILALVSCWVAMSLTGWGSISGGIVEDREGGEGAENHDAANPQVGKLNMVMIAVSQWLTLTLYAWTLVAPRLFPNRDFSY